MKSKVKNFVKESASSTGQKVNKSIVASKGGLGSGKIVSMAKKSGGMSYANYPNHLMGQGDVESKDFGKKEGKC